MEGRSPEHDGCHNKHKDGADKTRGVSAEALARCDPAGVLLWKFQAWMNLDGSVALVKSDATVRIVLTGKMQCYYAMR